MRKIQSFSLSIFHVWIKNVRVLKKFESNGYSDIGLWDIDNFKLNIMKKWKMLRYLLNIIKYC